jgi:hypothetical protein
MLCSIDSLFRPPVNPNSDLNTLRKRALALKEDLRIFELESASRKNRGTDPCPVTDQRIDEIKQEQYAISQKL